MQNKYPLVGITSEKRKKEEAKIAKLPEHSILKSREVIIVKGFQ